MRLGGLLLLLLCGHCLADGCDSLAPPAVKLELHDEPISLDTRTSFEVLVLFQQLHAQGRTIIFVTHNPEIARYSSRNVTLRDGHIISDVRNEQILSAAEALAKLPATDD